MFKQIFHVVTILLLMGINVSFAEEGVNIFPTPRAVPEHKIIHQSGKNYKLSDFRGNFVLAIFWSRTCGPCIKELRSLNGFYNATKDENIKLVLISPNDEWQTVEQQRRFLNKYGATDVDFYVDENGQVAADFGIFTNPHTVLINKQGQEIGRIRGSAKWDDKKVIEYIRELAKKHG